ncbi:hypothetical protein A3Q56_00970 [Intoshia linei]|uniref:ethanolamine-phosphate cytidylyltransferase n=1 Tax=Intoshia linei TaxID=1819745 RepID=A0A177BAC0_9BILA|nr:hypothetical protein A3Q56_00970 [Intoshia linei]
MSQIVRVWTDGCFDMVHYGHCNAIRQAKELGDYLIVGVHSDAEILKHKGPPVFNERERYDMIRALKWVDEVIEDAPYITSIDTLNKYNCDFCVHGDDITLTSDGKDTYEIVKNLNRYREIPRTKGISTTDLVGRMLLATKKHHEVDEDVLYGDYQSTTFFHVIFRPVISIIFSINTLKSPYTGSQYYATTGMIEMFSKNKENIAKQNIVYVDGGFDMCLNVSFTRVLEESATHGDFLIVGVQSDSLINKIKGGNNPIMNMHERVLGVLANKHTCEVVMNSPYCITPSLVSQFNISKICCCSDQYDNDRFKHVREMGILVKLNISTLSSVDVILNRMISNR